MRKPDFFIVGAPKCGTTAMDNYLRQHPEVFMALEKESHFFASDFHRPEWRFEKEEDYLSLFSSACDERVLGESSVGYLYSEVAAERIKAFNPQARIIIMLRNPVDLIYSFHSELLFQGFEEIESFEEALALESKRRQGLCMPQARFIARPLLLYRELGKFTSHVERFFELFNRRNVHVVIFDEFKKDTARAYREVCTFLGVNTDFQPNWRPGQGIINSNKRIRHQSLSRFLKNPERKALGYVKALLPQPLRRSIARQLWSFNVKFEPRPAMSVELKKSLSAEFAPDVERLSQLLGRDLTHWSRS